MFIRDVNENTVDCVQQVATLTCRNKHFSINKL
jgi:hypothetical protein